MTDCIEIYTDVTYGPKHNKSKEKHCGRKFVFHDLLLFFFSSRNFVATVGQLLK